MDVLVTLNNEGWYVGKLEVARPRSIGIDLEDTNPVKLDYQASAGKIQAIEDRHGDGAVYCVECGRLFWGRAVIQLEDKKGHQLLGPMEEFTVDPRPQ